VVRDGRDPVQGNASGGRWDPTLFDVLYSSLDPDGAVAEVHFHLSHQPVFPSKIRYGLHRIRVKTTKSLRLQDLDAMIGLGVEPTRYREVLYEPTQAIGDAAYFLGFDSLIAPNAWWSRHNLILFHRSDRACRFGSHRVGRSQLDRMEEEAKVRPVMTLSAVATKVSGRQ
jgi:RES domain-containing protein